jgi:putative ABC transport system permease protein
MRITEGRWWQGRPAEPEVSVADYFTEHLALRVGALLEFRAAGKTVKARLTSIRSVGIARPGSNNAFIFSPGALDGFPFSYVFNVRMRPQSAGSVQKVLFDKFPTVTSINVGELLVLVQTLLDRISLVIQFVAAFAILAGVIIMASSVASTRQRRIRESVLFKTLGATRSLVRRIHDVEFLILGSAAGAVGTAAANGLAWYLLGHLLDTSYVFNWMSLLGGTIATAMLAVLTGRLASRGILNQKPLQVLREE